MRPLTRVVPRLFDSIAPSNSRATQISNSIPRATSICLQCRIRSQVRRFADSSNKPPNPSNPPVTDPKDAFSSSSPKPSALEDAVNSNAPHTEETIHNLPSTQEGRRPALSKRFSHLMDHLQGNIFIASQRLNDLTGYSGIEALKARITRLEARVQSAQDLVRTSRNTYKTTVADRAATQREVTGLLARKDTWTPGDLERFTALYRMDHGNEQAVVEAANRLAEAEREAEHAASTLSSSILSRYHEEQIWSDKIRRMSTWGTWGLMGVNVLLFLVFQFGFEPWRRRRLVHGFEEKVREALEKEKVARGLAGEQQVPLDAVVAAGMEELEVETGGNTPEPAVDAVVACISGEDGPDIPTMAAEQDAALDSAEMHIPNAFTRLRKTEPWAPYIAAMEDLFSAREVKMKRQDVTIVALEGAAIGATIVTIIATFLLRPS